MNVPKDAAEAHTMSLDLEIIVLRIIQLGRSRCGAGFGKYPLGIRDAVTELLVLVPNSEKVREKLAEFDRKLAE
jgi:hypothetical protein